VRRPWHGLSRTWKAESLAGRLRGPHRVEGRTDGPGVKLLQERQPLESVSAWASRPSAPASPTSSTRSSPSIPASWDALTDQVESGNCKQILKSSPATFFRCHGVNCSVQKSKTRSTYGRCCYKVSPSYSRKLVPACARAWGLTRPSSPRTTTLFRRFCAAPFVKPTTGEAASYFGATSQP
jgi:hypothetical protein